MQQIILVLSAVILGLAFGHLTGGFAFSSAVCLVAGVFLVTPSLFKTTALPGLVRPILKK